jgi:hypothetical protein
MSLTTVVSYLTVAEASEYFAHRLDSDMWLKAEPKDKESSLIMATRAINSLPFSGYRVDENQNNMFPRKVWSMESAEYVEQSDTPQSVLDACCEEALFLIKYSGNERLMLQSLGVKRASRDGIAEEYAGIKRIVHSPEALELLRPWIARNVPIRNGQ